LPKSIPVASHHESSLPLVLPASGKFWLMIRHQSTQQKIWIPVFTLEVAFLNHNFRIESQNGTGSLVFGDFPTMTQGKPVKDQALR
jgi:hypothetical protein